MFKNNDKNKLYWLIDQYLLQNINAWDFCREYHACYDLELDLSTLTDKEYPLFSELSTVAGRFSPYQNDHATYPGVYYTEAELTNSVKNIKYVLSAIWPLRVVFSHHVKSGWVICKRTEHEFYKYHDSSCPEMGLLGIFLTNDVGCQDISHTIILFTSDSKLWDKDDKIIKLTENEEGSIILTDKYSTLQDPCALKIPKEYLLSIIEKWREKVCKTKPKEVIIKYENDQLSIETKN